MDASNPSASGLRPPDRCLAATHEVVNQPTELADYNLYACDRALREAVAREGAGVFEPQLLEFGRHIGSAEYLELGHLANRYPPEFEPHDRFGHRTDLVRFHPSYHALMRTAIAEGLHASPWSEPGPGAHVVRAARYYLHAQVEAGHGCPITMTFAAVPSLRLQPDLASLWERKITSREYDPANRPAHQKQAVTVGMAMTEKQGGSDVRANTTRADPMSSPGPGQPYELVGHKFFVSAPMCDLFLVLAQAAAGLTCFLLPRWRPDGTKNPMQLQRLKRKMGNVSNASSETELRGALAWMVGEEGRGIRTIIEMVAMTRFDCMIGSSAGMRMAVSQALHHCSQRRAFGHLLVDQPLMKNVLADLALESEAALALTMRIARSLDQRAQEHEDLLARLCTAVGKYWICKRTASHAVEAMECIGGGGVMEDSPMPRLYREAPVNAIWEGSGNIQCLDVLRAVGKTPAVVGAYFDEVSRARGGHPSLDRHTAKLQADLRDSANVEVRARDLVDRMAAILQAALLVQHAPDWVADAFCRSRLDGVGHHQFGALPADVPLDRIIERSMPREA
jgi:putative acyl-CoA dehydrogenase